MRIEEQDFSYKEDARLREKQSVCPHPSLKCSLCGIYKDNLFNEYQAQIDVLLLILEHYETVLDINSIQHPKYFDLLDNDIINMWETEKVKQYILKTERHTDEPIWHSE